MGFVFGGLMAVIMSFLSVWYLRRHEKKKEEHDSKKEKIIWIFIVIINLAIGISYELLLPSFDYGQLKILRLIFISSISILIGIIDYREHLIHNKMLLSAMGVRMVFFILEAVDNFELFEYTAISAVAGAFIALVILLVCRALSKRSIGMGDIKFFGVIGLYFGMDILGVMIVSFASCAICNVYGLIRKKKSKKDLVALAPYIAFGICFTVIFG